MKLEICKRVRKGIAQATGICSDNGKFYVRGKALYCTVYFVQNQMIDPAAVAIGEASGWAVKVSKEDAGVMGGWDNVGLTKAVEVAVNRLTKHRDNFKLQDRKQCLAFLQQAI